MAILLQPTGEVRRFEYRTFKDAVRELGGYFETVPYQVSAGYLVLVHETGALDGLPRNDAAQRVTGYPEIYGPAVIVRFEEAGEDELLHRVNDEKRAAFERRLEEIEA